MDFQNRMNRMPALAACSICPRSCKADRLNNRKGYCRSDDSFNIASICIHRGEEPPISGKGGICNVFFTNCNLQCLYCQNYQISDNRVCRTPSSMTLDEAVSGIKSILDQGIKRVGFVSPSHCVPQMHAIIDAIESLGYKPVWIYNSNGYDKPETLRSLEGTIDVYLPDFKYMDSELAGRLSDAPDYPQVAVAALKEMFRQKGTTLLTDDEGGAASGLIIRHLVLPGYVENSLKVMKTISDELSPRIHVSLMSQYHPTSRSAKIPGLDTTLKNAEYEIIVSEMESLGINRGWIQDYESHGHYVPDFDQEHPFEYQRT